MLTEGLQQISERVVAASGAVPDEGFDLAVVVNPRRAVLDRAWRSLRPGGACYSAWYWPFSGGARGVSRRLRAARFDMLGCYMPWPVPPFRTPRVWLPVDQPGAVNYFLSSRPRTRSPARELSRRLLRQLWRASLKLGFGLPICALACKPPIGHTPGSEPLLEWVRGNWSSWQLGPTPEHLSSLLLTGGPRTSSKVVALIFGEPEARPRVALKMARTPEAAASLRAAGRTFQLRGCLLVGTGRRGSSMPCAPVRISLGIGRLRERVVNTMPVSRSSCVVGRGSDERVCELDATGDSQQSFVRGSVRCGHVQVQDLRGTVQQERVAERLGASPGATIELPNLGPHVVWEHPS